MVGAQYQQPFDSYFPVRNPLSPLFTVFVSVHQPVSINRNARSSLPALSGHRLFAPHQEILPKIPARWSKQFLVLSSPHSQRKTRVEFQRRGIRLLPFVFDLLQNFSFDFLVHDPPFLVNLPGLQFQVLSTNLHYLLYPTEFIN